MEFGFGSLVDKLEEYFGRRATGAFLSVLGVGAVVIVGREIVGTFIPVVNWAYNTPIGSSVWYWVYRSITFVSSVVFLVLLFSFIASMVSLRAHLKRLEVDIGQFSETMQGASHILGEARLVMLDTRDMLAEELGEDHEKVKYLDEIAARSSRAAKEFEREATETRDWFKGLSVRFWRRHPR